MSKLEDVRKSLKNAPRLYSGWFVGTAEWPVERIPVVRFTDGVDAAKHARVDTGPILWRGDHYEFLAAASKGSRFVMYWVGGHEGEASTSTPKAGETCRYRPFPRDAPSSVIPDAEFIGAIEAVKADGRPWATVWDLQNALGVRASLVRRKARRCYRRGLVTGCICGCRGDFDTTPEGRTLLDAARHPESVGTLPQAGLYGQLVYPGGAR